MRSLVELVKNDRKINFASLYNAESNYFYAWLKQKNKEELQKDIITLRKEYQEEHKKEKDLK